MSTLVKYNSLLHCIERLDQERKVQLFKDFGQSPPLIKSIVHVGSPPTMIILPSIDLSWPRSDKYEDAMMSEDITFHGFYS